MLTLLVAVLLGQVAPALGCDPSVERAAVELLLERGEPRAAVERARTALEGCPADPALELLLARAYLLDGNLFWAERTLREAVARRPTDVQARAWLASVHLRQGDPDLARSDLPVDLAPAEGPDAARWRLLEAFRAELAGEAEQGREALAAVPRSAEVHPEDRTLWTSLERRLDPEWVDPLVGSLDLELGRTSNALAGSPTDPAEAGAGSGLADLRFRLGLAPPGQARWRPKADLELDGHILEAPEVRELSTLSTALRLAGLRSTGRRRLLLGYRAELLLVDQDEAVFAEAHRGELELDTGSGWLVFAGGGHRSYRDERRSRWEVDGGLGGNLRSGATVPVMAGGTLRLAHARSPAYDQLGASLAVTTRVPLGHGFTARAAATVTFDDYPRSAGSEGLLVFGSAKRRQDLLGRLTLSLLAPSWHGLRPGFEGQLARRDSTLSDLPNGSYDFDEWRVVLTLRWSFFGNAWAPRAVRVPGHVPLDWGLGREEEGDSGGILELLRQDEELRRSSSCGIGVR